MATRTPKIPARNTLLNSSLDGMDDLFDFKTKEEVSQPEEKNEGTGITEMDFAVMEPLPNHKFKLYTGQRLWDMVDSIREFGILEPLIVWVHDGKNTILSGHNRQNAGSIAGLTKGPVIIRENLTYEDAVLIATETNLRQRSFDDLSPSEKAYCLKQHYDAIKSQGRRNDLIKEIEELVNPHEIGENGTSSEIQKKLNANEKVSEEYGLGKDKIAKYLRIAALISPLMELLDNRKIAFEAAYDISFVKEEEKQYLIAEMIEAGHGVDIKKSTLIHDYGINMTATADMRSGAPASHITQVQTCVAYFPEFHYTDYWRLLEPTTPGYSAQFEFQRNEYSTYNRRTHFTPVWFPDGSYTVYAQIIDAWTPAGMLQMHLNDTLTIHDNLFSDWHVRPLN